MSGDFDIRLRNITIGPIFDQVFQRAGSSTVWGRCLRLGVHAPIYGPAGLYRCASGLNVPSPVGLTFTGDGQSSTVLVLDNDAIPAGTALFAISQYFRVTFRGVGFRCGTLSSAVPPAFISLAEADRKNLCLKFNTTGNGSMYALEHCMAAGFDRALDTTSSTTNGDMHRYDFCTFRDNNDVWYNSNNQAVIWEFNQCQVHHNRRIFYNPAGRLTVRGGDYINPGDLYVADSADASIGGRSTFDGVKFETYQNIDPTSSPPWLVLSGQRPGQILFRDCDTRSGTAFLDGKTSAVLSGVFDVKFEGGFWDGVFEVTNNTVVGSRTSSLAFDHCLNVPVISQTLVSAAGNQPLNLSVKNLGGLEEEYVGLASSGTTGKRSLSTTSFRTQATINNSSVLRVLDALPRAPYKWLFAGGRLSFIGQTNQTVTFTIWADDTKAVKIWEKILAATANVERFIRIDEETLIANPPKAFDSAKYAFEISSAQNMGVTSVTMQLEFMQAAKL